MFSLILVVGCGKVSSDKEEIITMNLAATSQTSGYYPFNVAVADIINKHVDGVHVTVLETGGTMDNLNLIDKGEAELGQCGDIDLYTAYKGLGVFEGRKTENSRMLWAVNPSALLFAVTEASNVKNLSELEGVKYNPGLQGSITETYTYTILEELGIKPEYVPGSLNDSITAIQDRRLSGLTRIASVITPDATIQQIETTIPMRVLSFNEGEIQKIREKFTHFTKFEIDGSLYKQDADILTLGGFFGTVVSKDVPEDLVYKIVKAVFENQEYIEQVHPGMKGYNMVELTANQGAWLHPGVIKYLREKGYQLADHVIPPEMK